MLATSLKAMYTMKRKPIVLPCSMSIKHPKANELTVLHVRSMDFVLEWTCDVKYLTINRSFYVWYGMYFYVFFLYVHVQFVVDL